MDEKNNAEKCSNCKYFQRYYVIGCDRTYSPTRQGRCININISKTLSKKHVKNDNACDLWLPYELKKLNIHYTMEKKIKKICNDLSSILEILRDIK